MGYEITGTIKAVTKPDDNYALIIRTNKGEQIQLRVGVDFILNMWPHISTRTLETGRYTELLNQELGNPSITIVLR